MIDDVTYMFICIYILVYRYTHSTKYLTYNKFRIIFLFFFQTFDKTL